MDDIKIRFKEMCVKKIEEMPNLKIIKDSGVFERACGWLSCIFYCEPVNKNENFDYVHVTVNLEPRDRWFNGDEILNWDVLYDRAEEQMSVPLNSKSHIIKDITFYLSEKDFPTTIIATI